MQSGMKEPHEKGVANHLNLDSCAGCREVPGESVNRGIDGPGIELQKNAIRAPDACLQREGHTGGNAIASVRQARMRKTARPVVWEGAGAQFPALDPILWRVLRPTAVFRFRIHRLLTRAAR